MQNLIGVTGTVSLFVAEGGPGQRKWYNIRIWKKLTLHDIRSASVYCAGRFTFGLPNGEEESHSSTHVLLTTGDEVILDVSDSVGDVVFSANVDTEEL